MSAIPVAQKVLRLGTRGSLLARMQSQWVAGQLERHHPSLKVETVICRTTGDQVTDRPLHDIGGKGLFTKELEEALLDHRVDLVVHSMKDVPVTMPLVDTSALTIAAVPSRADARDVLITREGIPWRQMQSGAVVATGSLRRRCQLLDLRPDLKIRPLRGNVDTRLRRVADGAFDAVVLALAGVRRANLYNSETMSIISADDVLPAAGQGALALQCRADDADTRSLAGVMNDSRTRICVDIERYIVRQLDGDCHSPIAVLAEIDPPGALRLRAAVGQRGGEPSIVRAEARGDVQHAPQIVDRVLQRLTEQHAHELLGTQCLA